MEKLDWQEENNRSGYSRKAEYRGLVIRQVQDSDCRNPWEDSDGMTPLIYYSLGDGMTDHSGAYDIESPFHVMSDGFISRHFKRLAAALDQEPEAAEAEARESQRDYGGRLADIRRDLLENYLAELVPSDSRSWGVACDYFAALESLWQIAGVVALDFQRNGYSQGDSIRGLLVALPEWRKAMGIPAGHDMQADLERQADTLGAWAFGDCYGYEIETPDGESLDSCWGYIGDADESGLEEAAISTADSILASAARRRGDKLKELIRARVPLHLRPALLDQAGSIRSAYHG